MNFEKPKTEIERRWHWWWRKETRFYRFDLKNFSIVLKPMQLGEKLEKMLERKKPRTKKERARYTYPHISWKTGQVAAFRYELARRFDRNWRTDPYINADPRTRDLLMPIKHRPRIVFGEPPPNTDNRWITIPQMHIPPDLSLRGISEILEEVVKRKSKQQAVERPKGPANQRNRPVSWRWVELLDEVDLNKKEKLDDNERSMKSDARTAAEDYHHQFVKLLKDFAHWGDDE